MVNLLGSPRVATPFFFFRTPYGDGIRGMYTRDMTGAIIPALMHRSHQNSEVKRAWARVVTRMGDLLGSPRVAPLFVFFRTPYGDGIRGMYTQT
ncbi:hypothetical protein G2W53_009276 [Senna tora]|uniref:Uncharacterized protein n=1 Tax=Senna tora TaxID=362788 RepID=A0A834WYA7_9FABA|nr:hypothetical protein G2W53_009276 [Senna tora]